MPRYICDNWKGRSDASEFVLSGEYYFNCKRGFLVRREPLKISANEILNMKIKIRKTHDDRIDSALEVFLNSSGWADGFEYTYSDIVSDPYNMDGPNSKIDSHNFEKRIRIGNDKFIVTLTKGVHLKNVPIILSIDDYEFLKENYQTYEQLREEAKNSCDEKQ